MNHSSSLPDSTPASFAATPRPAVHEEDSSSSSVPSWELDAEERNRALLHVYEAIKALPASFTKDYRTALATVPDIVSTETNPLKFLRFCNGDPWSAAVRLCHNLTYRRETFGPDHWLKPMRMSRDGALRMEDVDFLRSGAFAIVTAPDGSQRQVMVVNFGRLKGKDHGVRQRVAHYLCLTQINEYTQRNGLSVLVVIDGTGMKVRQDNGKLFQISHTVTVFTIDQVILANDPNETRQILANLFGLMMRRLAEKFWGKQGRIVNVKERTPQATLEALIARGLHPSCIPTQLGGLFSYDRDFKKWLATRICTEQTEASQGVTVASTCHSFPVSPLAAPLPQAQISPSFGGEWEYMNDHQQVAVDRPPTSSQSAWNFPIPFSQFFSNSTSVNNHQHTTNNSNPQTMMTEISTRSLVDDHTQNSDYDSSSRRQKRKRREVYGTDYVRKRNCEYSKKHYYKKKSQIQTLQDECEDLEKEQRKLKEENRRLMDLVKQAQSLLTNEAGV